MTKAVSGKRDDSDRIKDALRKLRTENRRLRKDNSQLKKELNRTTEVEFEQQFEAEEAEAGPMDFVEVGIELTCPKCKSRDYAQIAAGKYQIKVCKACGFRKRTETRP